MANRQIRPIRIEDNIAYVPLTKGYEAVIDAVDVPRVEGANWCAWIDRRSDGTVRNVYAKRGMRHADGKWRSVTMHRVIAETPHGFTTDHRDGNGLNNRRANLRFATPAQNMHNQGLRINNQSGLKGVSWDKRANKWRASISLRSKTRYLGCFDTPEDAAAAYASASVKLHGAFGRTT